jgi:EAL and modified HD-GYP domain-containing signal transduction protein
LLNHLALDRDTGVIAEAVRGDVALSLRLLRYANSPAIGLAQPVDTVEQAVLVLGRSELYRWLSVQLLSAAHSRQASRGLQETALARGRLLEGIARQRGEPVPGALFTLGMLSLIEALMQTPMAQALAPLRLAEPVRDALLKRQGPMASYLGLLDAIDAGDAAQLEALAHALGVQDRWADLNDEAWAWAAALV